MRENGHSYGGLSLMEGEWSCLRVRGGQFNGGRMVLLQRAAC